MGPAAAPSIGSRRREVLMGDPRLISVNGVPELYIGRHGVGLDLDQVAQPAADLHSIGPFSGFELS